MPCPTLPTAPKNHGLGQGREREGEQSESRPVRSNPFLVRQLHTYFQDELGSLLVNDDVGLLRDCNMVGMRLMSASPVYHSCHPSSPACQAPSAPYRADGVVNAGRAAGLTRALGHKLQRRLKEFLAPRGHCLCKAKAPDACIVYDHAIGAMVFAVRAWVLRPEVVPVADDKDTEAVKE